MNWELNQNTIKLTLIFTFIFSFHSVFISAQSPNQSEIDKQVQKFLDDNRYSWRDMNVPVQDGQILHDLIVENNYTSALEIGTSTGHSTVWIAWAMSKTGGKVTTIEIDEGRHKEALSMAKKAISLNPRGFQALFYWALGSSYLMMGQYDEAISALKKAINLWPD